MSQGPAWQISPLDTYIRRYSPRFGNDPTYVAIVAAVARAEGGWGPWNTTGPTVGDNGCSFGPFQMNTCGGLGTGHSPSNLINPDYAARIMMPLFENAYSARAGQQLSLPELAARIGVSVERPADSSGTSYYNAARGLQAQVNAILAGTGLAQLPPENNIAPIPGESTGGVDPNVAPGTGTGIDFGGVLGGGIGSAFGGLAQNTIGKNGFIYQHLPAILLGGLGITILVIAIGGFALQTFIKVKMPSMASGGSRSESSSESAPAAPRRVAKTAPSASENTAPAESPPSRASAA